MERMRDGRKAERKRRMERRKGKGSKERHCLVLKE